MIALVISFVSAAALASEAPTTAPSAPLLHTESTSDAPAPAPRRPLGLQIRPSAGVAFFGPKALNNWMGEMNNTSANYQFNGAGNVGISVDYVLSTHFLGGIRADYLFSKTAQAALNTGSGQITTQASFGALPIYLTGTLVEPLPSGWKIGVTAGGGVAPVYHTWFDVSHSTDANYPQGTLNFSATPLTMFGSVFISYDVTRTMGVRFDTSYRFLSAPDIRTSSAYGAYAAGDSLQDTAINGANVNLDASSFLMTLGLVVNL